MPNILSILSAAPSPNPRQAAAYALNIAAEKYGYNYIHSYSIGALEALSKSVMMGDEDGNGSRGECTDNAVAAVGIILEVLNGGASSPSLNYGFMWESWISYLPIKHDLVSLVLCFICLEAILLNSLI